MVKKILFISFSFGLFINTSGQTKSEKIVVEWPGKQKWKVINQQDDSLNQTVMLIPENENINNTPIIGVIRVVKGMHYKASDSMFVYYKSHIDSATTITLLEKDDTNEKPWILFKVETPITNKYSEPESDLYYIVQGQNGVYEVYAAIKQPSLSLNFAQFWGNLFKQSKIKID